MYQSHPRPKYRKHNRHTTRSLSPILFNSIMDNIINTVQETLKGCRLFCLKCLFCPNVDNHSGYVSLSYLLRYGTDRSQLQRTPFSGSSTTRYVLSVPVTSFPIVALENPVQDSISTALAHNVVFWSSQYLQFLVSYLFLLERIA